MRAILSKIVEPEKIKNKEVSITNYKDYYKFGDFELFDVVRVRWLGEDISIYLDDEGLLKEGNYGRMVAGYYEPLFGNLIVTGGVDEEGETLPLPDKFTVDNINEFIFDVEFMVER